ncbi:hypothetical protein [Pseudoalteromonas phage PH357]|nr:hypothetical protein [Pseudoalteromonas phage PH357]
MKTKTSNNFIVPENFEESIKNFHTKEQSQNKLSNRSKKPLITQSKLFLEVASVIGKVRALEELTKAYKSYEEDTAVCKVFYWEKDIFNAFSWVDTIQGYDFWNEIRIKVMFDA